MRKNQSATLSITGMTSEGNGVARTPDGMAVFIPNVIEGETVQTKIVKVQKTFCYGKVEKIVTASPHRQESDCPVSQSCGGCTFRHMSYEEELRVKTRRVQDAFARIAGLDITPNPIIAAPQTDRYRNKAQIPIGQTDDGRYIAGYFAKSSHRIIGQEDCLLQPEVFQDITDIVLRVAGQNGVSAYNEQTGEGLLRHIFIRRMPSTQQMMVCLVTARPLPCPQAFVDALKEVPDIASIYENINGNKGNAILSDCFSLLWGQPKIEEELLNKTFELSPKAFFQVNSAQAARLYQLAGQYAALSGTETVLDLYCGTGTIGLTMADRCRQLIGVEVEPQAVQNAQKNAVRNQIANARFLCADAPQAARQLKQEGIRPDVVLVDPPRKGCTESLLQTLSEMATDRIVYISCDPATLARDIKTLTQQATGYQIKAVTPVDLFPRTPHVETVCLLLKR